MDVEGEVIKDVIGSYFDTEPTCKQLEIIKSVINPSDKRVVISAFTRYGKTYAVALGIVLYIYMKRDKKVLVVAPDYNQAKLLRDYVVEFIIESPVEKLIPFDVDRKEEKMKREISRDRITFSNGCELKIMSAQGKAERLMGHGGDLLVLDESCLIDYEVYRSKISRMLGDSPDSCLVEIGNPWDRDNQMWEHWTDPDFKNIHIPYDVGVEEGRVDEDFIEEQRNLLTETEFKVLYEAEFPEQSEDALFNWSWIKGALDRGIEMDDPELVMGLDVAEQGVDLTVLSWVYKEDDEIKVEKFKSWDKADTMKTTGWILQELKKYEPSKIFVDKNGVGKGVYDQLKQEADTDVIGIKVNRKPIQDKRDRYRDRKAQFYWELRDKFEAGDVDLCEDRSFMEQARKMKYDFTSRGKIQIEDPEKSPDYCDSLMLALTEGVSESYSVLDSEGVDVFG